MGRTRERSMRSRSTLVLGIVTLLLVGAALALATAVAGTAAAGQGDQAAGNATIEVTASAEAAAAPDRAVVRPAVVATGETAEGARRQVAESAATMRAAIRDLGIADDRVRTIGFDIRPITDSTGEETEIRGYRAEQRFEIEVDASAEDLGASAGTVVDTAVQSGANEVDGVRFTLSPDRRQSLREQALQRATTDARNEADHLADLSDLAISGVGSISTGGGGVSPFDARLEDAPAGGGGTVIEPGQVSVSATVTVVYRAE